MSYTNNAAGRRAAKKAERVKARAARIAAREKKRGARKAVREARRRKRRGEPEPTKPEPNLRGDVVSTVRPLPAPKPKPPKKPGTSKPSKLHYNCMGKTSSCRSGPDPKK
jgi:sRNA-binding protein